MAQMELSQDQQAALDAVEAGRNVFITGPAGVGKSELVRRIIKMFERKFKPPYRELSVTASTGIAAINVGGRTVHSFLGTGIAGSIAELKQKPPLVVEDLVDRLTDTRVLIVDEISMLSGDYLDMMNMHLKRITGRKSPFAGIQLIFVGDFLQLPPVNKGSRKALPMAFESDAWWEAELEPHVLSTTFRQTDPALIDALMRIRRGEVDEGVLELFNERVGAELPYPTTLYSHVAPAREHNHRELAKIDAPVMRPRMAVEPVSDRLPQKRIDSFVDMCPVDQPLELKEGASVLLTVNSPPDYVNGTRGTIVGTLRNVQIGNELYKRYGRAAPREFLQQALIIETEAGRTINVHPYQWCLFNAGGRPMLRVIQYPVRLAWALTIHKAQGMSLSQLRCDIQRVFTASQAYVALSRVRSLEGLSMISELQARHVYINPTVRQFYEWLDDWTPDAGRFTSPEPDMTNVVW